MHTPRRPTVSVTMTPAQSFHPSTQDDLSIVPSDDEEASATAPAPMEIIGHDAGCLVQYLDGMDSQRVAEHEDVKDRLDQVEEELKKLADFALTEASEPRRPASIRAKQVRPSYVRSGDRDRHAAVASASYVAHKH
jgi:hypothetical protein